MDYIFKKKLKGQALGYADYFLNLSNDAVIIYWTMENVFLILLWINFVLVEEFLRKHVGCSNKILYCCLYSACGFVVFLKAKQSDFPVS